MRGAQGIPPRREDGEYYFKNFIQTKAKTAVSDHYRNQSQGDWPGPGYVVLIDNFTDAPGSIMKETTTAPKRIFNVDEYYLYDWVVTNDVKQVPDVVQQGAGPGPEWGKIGAVPTPRGCHPGPHQPDIKVDHGGEQNQ
jgi:hypothetical protein